ncbi:MAG: hypothetical protein JW869_06725 [Candidatus Omnitrophica bacterium]|nr:hypothetical protein [Candidatus Omnitrophota bacterium]
MNKAHSFRLKGTLLLGVLLIVCAAFEAFAENWEEIKGDHFIVYYTRSRTFGKEALRKAEEYYDKIANDLGYARRDKFWNWDDRVKIYIYPSEKAYLDYVKSMGYAEWSVGFADYCKKEIVSYHHGKGFLDAILPHELTHLLFRDYVGTKNIPMWIDEGVAQWQEKGRLKEVNKELRREFKNHSPIPMERMMSLNIAVITNEFIVDLYYLQAVSMVDFMITRYGSEKFVYFCRQLRDGKRIDNALKFTYPTMIRTTEDLEREWLEYLQVD